MVLGCGMIVSGTDIKSAIAPLSVMCSNCDGMVIDGML